MLGAGHTRSRVASGALSCQRVFHPVYRYRSSAIATDNVWLAVPGEDEAEEDYEVMCPYSTSGCTFSCPLSELEQHLSTCEHCLNFHDDVRRRSSDAPCSQLRGCLRRLRPQLPSPPRRHPEVRTNLRVLGLGLDPSGNRRLIQKSRITNQVVHVHGFK